MFYVDSRFHSRDNAAYLYALKEEYRLKIFDEGRGETETCGKSFEPVQV
jgi:hypothetical protein